MCSVYYTKYEDETDRTVAGALMLLCLVTRSQAKSEPGYTSVCMCVYFHVSQNRKSLSC